MYITISKKLYEKIVKRREECYICKTMFECIAFFGNEYKMSTDDLIENGLDMETTFEHLNMMVEK